MRFVLAKGQSQYGSLRLHIDQLAAALVGLGHEAPVVDLIPPEGAGQLISELEAGAQVLLTLGGVASEVAAPGRFFEAPRFLFATIHVDHPAHGLDRLGTPAAKKAAFFLDRTHVAFMTAWSPGRSFAHIGLLPPGANELAEPVDTSEEAFARRDIGLMFTGTYRGPPKPGWVDWQESPAKALVAETADRMAADARLPLLDALKATLARHDIKLSGEVFEAIAPLLSAAQLFAEAYHRHAILTALGEAGVEVEVWGSGWEPMSARHPSFRWMGVGSFEETLSLLRRARLVLNINNGFVAGGHERVFTAMCAGAAVVSDASRYYADAFKEGVEIATFAWPRLPQAVEQIAALKADEARLAAMARAGERRARSEHRWIHRAAQLVKAIKPLV